MSTGTRENKSREVERYLYRLVDSASNGGNIVGDDYVVCNLKLTIQDSGSWIVKFLPSGRVLLNNCEIIMTTDSIQVDASISFASLANFWAIINGQLRFEAGVKDTSGSEEALKWFKQHIFATTVEGTMNYNHMSTKSQARALLAPDPIEKTQLILEGWLIKKRDIMHGWKSRYFKVYVNRFEYFVDPQDDVPRAVIPLLDCKVSVPREMRNRMKNRGVYHQIIVQPKYHEKSFKFISRLKGAEGLKEIVEWARAFEMASEPAEKSAKLLQTRRSRMSSIAPFKIAIDDEDDEVGMGEGSTANAKESIVGKCVFNNGTAAKIRQSISGTFGKGGGGGVVVGEVPMVLCLAGAIVVIIAGRIGMTYGGIDIEALGYLTISVGTLMLVVLGWEVVRRLFLLTGQAHAVHKDTTTFRPGGVRGGDY